MAEEERMSFLKTTIEGLGEVEVDAYISPADPDVGIPHAYIEEFYIYKDGEMVDFPDSFWKSDEAWAKLEQEYFNWVEELRAEAMIDRRD